MWRPDQIDIELDEESEADVSIIKITTPAGTIDLLSEIRLEGRIVRIDGAHIGGLSPGACGRGGLNAIGRRLLEWADADEIVIQGGARTTGKRAGKVPKRIRFPKD